jgi:hypothetical protein
VGSTFRAQCLWGQQAASLQPLYAWWVEILETGDIPGSPEGEGSSTLERAGHFCANLTCLLCGASQLGLKVFDLNSEGLLKILGSQKPLHEVSVRCNLPLNVCLEGAYLLLIGAWKTSHGRLDHIKVGLRSASHLFEIIKHHSSNGFERVLGFHGTLLASHVVYPQVVDLNINSPDDLVTTRAARPFPERSTNYR